MLQGPPKRADPGGRAAEARARVSVYTRMYASRTVPRSADMSAGSLHGALGKVRERLS